MANIPIEIEKQRVEIKKCTDIYDILEEFNFDFTAADQD
jgi:hypothetical protein